MARYPLFGTGETGRSVHYSAQRRLNLYCAIKQQGDRSQLAYYGTPGLALFASFGAEPVRGAHTFRDIMYVVHRGTLYSMNNSAVKTVLGTLSTTAGRVSMADNGTQIFMVDGTDGYIYNIDTGAFSVITDADFWDVANTCAYQAGRFLYDKKSSGQFGISASYDGAAHDATEFATSESFSDDMVRIFVDHSEVILFGSLSTEFWGNTGALDFPYQPINGAVVEYGLAARWSLAKLSNSVAFLGKNREGQVGVFLLKGYQPQRISTDEMEYTINNYSTVADASGFAYKAGGHTFYQLNFPTAGKSWLYDDDSKMWSHLEYGSTGGRHRAEFGVEFINKSLVFDYANGNVYQISIDATDDNEEPIVREIVGRHIIDEEMISISRMWLDIETGLGSDPQAMLSVSKDGGHSFGSERWTSLGAIGEFKTRAIWRVLGQAYDWVFKVRISGATKCTISGAWVDAK